MTVPTTTSKRVRVQRGLLLCVLAAAIAAIACWAALTLRWAREASGRTRAP